MVTNLKSASGDLEGLKQKRQMIDTSTAAIKDGLSNIKYVEGAVGAVGPAGKPGPPGPNGKDGTNGTYGKDGIAGKDGARGEVGGQGPEGLPGKDGRNGIDGRDGKDGAVGPIGAAGSNGKNGISGTCFSLFHQPGMETFFGAADCVLVSVIFIGSLFRHFISSLTRKRQGWTCGSTWSCWRARCRWC